MTVNAATLERLGRYEVLGEIASGGMATVFLGRVTGAKGFQRLVAIKRLHPHLESEEDFVAMFLDEARLAAKIRHQNVVGTLDVEDQEGLYIVMEYIEGDRLLGLLRHAAKTGERIPLAVAVRIALDTLAGLHAAHELHDDDGEPIGLVHRDVSPQNILIGVDGVARLTDFGIAKATSRLTVTRDGQLKGKIAYMAPEQTKRVEIDRRVDLFAMGIITWEMLTSKKLFTGESDVEVLNQLLFEPIPRLKESAPGIPVAIDAAVMRALERDPAKRYGTAAEFADALERASKVIGGPANARTVAAHLQKVSADKIAKDRARVATAGTPGTPADGTGTSRVQRRPTGSFPAVNTGQHANPIHADAATEAPASHGRPPPPPPTPARRPTMVGMAAPPPFPPPTKAPPSNPPQAAPSVTAEHTLIDDDEDIPTQAVVRTKEMAEAMGLPGRAMAMRPAAGTGPAVLPPSSRSPTGSLPAVAPAPRAPATGTGPAISAPGSNGSAPAASASSTGANAVIAVGPPAIPLTRPVSVPPPSAATARSMSLPEIPAEAPPQRGRGTLIVAMVVIALAGGVGAFVIMQRSGSSTAAAPTSPAPSNAVPAAPAVEPATAPANPPAVPANTGSVANPAPPPAVPPAEPPTVAVPPANAPPTVANALPPANPPAVTAPPANPPPAVTAPPVVAQPAVTPPVAHVAGPHPGHTGHTAAPSPHPTPAGTTPTPHPAGHGTQSDDPFGTDNPYQR